MVHFNKICCLPLTLLLTLFVTSNSEDSREERFH